MKKTIGKIFAFYKQDASIHLIIFGIKIKFKSPHINRLEDICLIPNLKDLEEKNTKFPHPIGIVIHPQVKIGYNCEIFQNVTIGTWNNKSPTIGNNVKIYANSVIIGWIKIGDNAIIGAGSVVLNDVPANAVVAGNPAKIIKYLDSDSQCHEKNF